MNMVENGLNYGVIMQRALRGVMREALSHVAEHGLPGEHHFYITYDTRHPEVVIPDWLKANYPEQITIVLQHEFSDLTVSDDGFAVRMSFSDRPAELFAPFDAVLTFVDPSVEFGLKFDGAEHDEPVDAETTDEPAEAGQGGAEVVSLDQFRKQ